MSTQATTRPVSFQQAKSQYVHRFTMEHVPAWARRSFAEAGTPLDKYPNAANEYPAPQYRTDREWYDAATFPGEGDLSKRAGHCESGAPTWPLGQRLAEPFGGARSMSELMDAYKATKSRSVQDALLLQMQAHPEHPNNRK